MKTWLKVILGILVVAGLSYGAILYTTFNGNPIKKSSLKDEAKAYLDEKYNREMVVEEGTFNLNIGYGAKAHPVDNPNLTFQLYQTSEGNWSDHYARTLWNKQITDDVLPEIKEEFPNAKHKVLGAFEEYYQGDPIPHYSEVDYSFNAVIHPSYEYNPEQKDGEFKKMYSLIQYYQSQNLQGGFKVSYPNQVFKFTDSEISKIQNMQDLNKFADRIG